MDRDERDDLAAGNGSSDFRTAGVLVARPGPPAASGERAATRGRASLFRASGRRRRRIGRGRKEKPWRTIAPCRHEAAAGRHARPARRHLLRARHRERWSARPTSRSPFAPIPASWPSSTAACASSSELAFSGALGALPRRRGGRVPLDEGLSRPGGQRRRPERLRQLRRFAGAAAGYRFHGDLRSDNTYWNVENKVGGESVVYCGPGVFYDRETGRIHCRLAPHEARRPGRRQLPRRNRSAQAAAGHRRRRTSRR